MTGMRTRRRLGLYRCIVSPDDELELTPTAELTLAGRPPMRRDPHLRSSLTHPRFTSLCSSHSRQRSVEVRLTPHSTLRHEHVRHLVQTYLTSGSLAPIITVGGVEIPDWQDVPLLEKNCESIKAAECCQSRRLSPAG